MSLHRILFLALLLVLVPVARSSDETISPMDFSKLRKLAPRKLPLPHRNIPARNVPARSVPRKVAPPTLPRHIIVSGYVKCAGCVGRLYNEALSYVGLILTCGHQSRYGVTNARGAFKIYIHTSDFSLATCNLKVVPTTLHSSCQTSFYPKEGVQLIMRPGNIINYMTWNFIFKPDQCIGKEYPPPAPPVPSRASPTVHTHTSTKKKNHHGRRESTTIPGFKHHNVSHHSHHGRHSSGSDTPATNTRKKSPPANVSPPNMGGTGGNPGIPRIPGPPKIPVPIVPPTAPAPPNNNNDAPSPDLAALPPGAYEALP